MARTGKQAQALRLDGFVTAVEIATATGRDLPSVHRDIRAEKIPGRKIGWGWYVDVHAYLDRVGDVYPKGTTFRAQLEELARDVPRSKVAASPPGPVS